MKRQATAVWTGTIKEGEGTVSTANGVLNKTQYSFKSRFEDGEGTNPEELMAAAHAGCFSMKLSGVLGAAGFTPEKIETSCEITLADGVISHSHLKVSASVPGISEEKFQECAEEAKNNCPVSKALNMEKSVEASLV